MLIDLTLKIKKEMVKIASENEMKVLLDTSVPILMR